MNKNLTINSTQNILFPSPSISATYKPAPTETSLISPSRKSTFRKFLAESITPPFIQQNTIVRRAAIDVGSGSTKVCIAEIDCTTNQIKNVLFEGSFAAPYQSYLEIDPNLQFNAEIQEKGLATFVSIQELIAQYQVTNVVAIATEAFRKAKNGPEFAACVKEKTGIPLNVISQEDEGMIAFYSAVSSSSKDPDDILIWDIGTGSFQMIAAHEGIDHALEIYMRSMGAVPFKKAIIQDIQGKDPAIVKTPNPMTQEDWEKADALARHMGRHAIPFIKEKMSTVEGHVVGIGRLFANSVQPMGTDGKIHRDDLRAFIRSSLGKTDEELGDPFANVNVSNAILVLGVMKALHIHEIEIIETTSTKGILSYQPYWN